MTSPTPLADIGDFDPNDSWQALYRGQDAGSLGSGKRSIVLRGGDRYRVQLDQPYDEDSGVDAPPGAVGELVAISERVGCAAVKTDDGRNYLVVISDLRPEHQA